MSAFERSLKSCTLSDCHIMYVCCWVMLLFMLCYYYVYCYVMLLLLFCFSVSVKWLAVKTASEMTYKLTVSSGVLNSTPTNQHVELCAVTIADSYGRRCTFSCSMLLAGLFSIAIVLFSAGELCVILLCYLRLWLATDLLACRVLHLLLLASVSQSINQSRFFIVA